MKQSIS